MIRQLFRAAHILITQKYTYWLCKQPAKEIISFLFIVILYIIMVFATPNLLITMKNPITLDTGNKFVGFVDIMGFKDKLFRKPHAESLKDILTFANAIEEVRKTQRKGEVKIQSANFSDSVLGVTREATSSEAHCIIRVFEKYFVEGLSSGIPIKGAMAYGEFTADFKKNVFCGIPLVDAYLLGEELGFYGVTLHHTFQRKLVDLGELNHFVKENWIIEYDTPFKSSGKSKHYCINWLKAVKDDKTDEVENRVKEFYLSSSGRIRLYVDNTLAFMDFCKRRMNKTE